MTRIEKLIKWWAKWRTDRRWRRLVRRCPKLNEILASAWRLGWEHVEWNVELADALFEQVPDAVILHGPLILDRIRGSFFDGALEKQMEIKDDERSEVVQQSYLPSNN